MARDTHRPGADTGCWAAVLLALAISHVLCAGGCVPAGHTEANAELVTRFEAVTTLLDRAVSQERKRLEIQRAFSGSEEEAVQGAVSILVSDTGSVEVRSACGAVLLCYEVATLNEFRRRLRIGSSKDAHLLHILHYWARQTSLADGLRLAVDLTVSDTTAAETASSLEFVGRPMRWCDLAFNLARDTISDHRQLLGRGISSRDAISARDQRIEGFCRWWQAHRMGLGWSADDGKFVIRDRE